MRRSLGTTLALLFVVTLGCGDDDGGDGSGGSSSGGSSTGLATGTSGGSTSDGGDASTTSGGSTSTGEGTTSGGASSSSSGAGESSESSTGGGEALGELMGRCGVLEAMDLTSDEPGFIVNTLDFGEVGFDYELLTPGGQQVFDDGNLGGSSLYSEVVAYEVLARCEDALLLKTEAEILYDDAGPRTDLLVEFDGTKIGVSVVRAQGFPLEDPYTVEQARLILEDKLGDIPLSSAAVSPEDAWEKQILHVVAYGPMHAESLQTAYEALGPEFTLDTIVVVTVTGGDDLFIYTE